MTLVRSLCHWAFMKLLYSCLEWIGFELHPCFEFECRLISSSLFVGASPVPVQGQRAACRHITRTTSDDEDYDDVDDDDGDVSATSLLLLLSWWFSRLWLVL